MSKDITSVEVHAIDEDVVCYFFEKDEEVGTFSLSVHETEDFVNMLKEAIDVAKTSKYYHE